MNSITFNTPPTGIVGLPPDLANAAQGWYLNYARSDDLTAHRRDPIGY